MPTSSSITVTKSSPVLVGPSAALPPVTEHITLSSFDKALAFFPMTSYHIFTRAIPTPAETVRRALSHALTYYYPVAGRFFVSGAGCGDLRIACTGEGVAFVAASASCSLRDVKLLDPPFHKLLLRELAVAGGLLGGTAGGLFRETDPLLLVQVTEFACGGFVVAVTRNHGVADGTGFAQFMQAVGELARGMPRPAVLPVSCGDASLPELPPPVAAMEKAMGALPHRDFAYLDITVPSACIARIKAGFTAAAAGGEPCTVFEVVVAVLWQCRTRAVMSSGGGGGDPEVPAPLVFAVGARGLVGAKRGYYGNCITSAVAVPARGEVAGGDINDVVRLIKRAKEQTLCHFTNKSSTGAAAGVGDVPSSAEELAALFGYGALVVTSWRNLGAEAVDLGGGAPARVMCRAERTAVPNCVACLPYEGKDGANVLAQCVKEEDADAFLGELAKFFV